MSKQKTPMELTVIIKFEPNRLHESHLAKAYEIALAQENILKVTTVSDANESEYLLLIKELS